MSQKARVAQSAEAYKRNRNKELLPFQIDPSAPQFLKRKGKWIKSDQNLDTEIETREQYQQLAAGAGGKGPYGELSVDSSFLEKIAKKKEQEQYLQDVKLGNYLIDPKIPESQERVFHILPELKEVPDKQFLQDVAQQEALRLMLRDGFVKGRDDHQLILSMMSSSYVLPLHALWNDIGDLLNIDEIRKLPIDTLTESGAPADAIYNPQRYAITRNQKANLKAYLDALIPIKKKILRRLYPGVAKMNAGQLDHFYKKEFINKDSVITKEPTGDSYFGWWNGTVKE